MEYLLENCNNVQFRNFLLCIFRKAQVQMDLVEPEPFLYWKGTTYSLVDLTSKFLNTKLIFKGA